MLKVGEVTYFTLAHYIAVLPDTFTAVIIAISN